MSDQDKPTVPPGQRSRKPRRATTRPKAHHVGLRRDEPFATASRLFGVTEDTGYVEIKDDQLEIRFGGWHLETPLRNVIRAEVTGPFHWWKVIGPPHLSLRDRGITFATSAGPALCVRFREPVAAIDPRGLIRHPGATVSVEDPEHLAELINAAAADFAVPITNALASVAVHDLAAVAPWYEALLGPCQQPMPEVMEWQLEDGGGLQVYVAPERAGHTSATLIVGDIDELADHLRRHNLTGLVEPTRSPRVDTIMIKDPDGNSLAFSEPKDETLAR